MTGMLHDIDRTGETGMVGKAAVIWLLLLAVLGVAVVDAVSIGRTTLHLSEVDAGRERRGRSVPFAGAQRGQGL